MPEKDEQEESLPAAVDLSHSSWYLAEFDRAIASSLESTHPKVSATVRNVVDLWEAGEKVLVFAFYVQTCKALRIHISNEIERRLIHTAQRRSSSGGAVPGEEDVESLLKRIQVRFFDRTDSPGRRAVDAELRGIVAERAATLSNAQLSSEQREVLVDVMRRFLRVSSTIARCFPFERWEEVDPSDAVRSTLDHSDGSGMSWRQKFLGFIDFLTEDCSTDEREKYLEAAKQIQTGGIRVEAGADVDSKERTDTLANVQVATGSTDRDTRARLMRAFNTPFFPDILVCSEVMSEGVDLQRSCRHLDPPRSRVEPQRNRTAHGTYRPARLQGRRQASNCDLPAVSRWRGR
ncbi:MAG: hypothetical protein IPF82_16840 [Blastocatellia bacterium]|nr:hypothetical protein [Blastocatellia bacterium]